MAPRPLFANGNLRKGHLSVSPLLMPTGLKSM